MIFASLMLQLDKLSFKSQILYSESLTNSSSFDTLSKFKVNNLSKIWKVNQ